MDSLNIGSSPSDEPCVQISTRVEYERAMREECRAYVKALRRFLGDEPPGARLSVKRHDHDFGSYWDVECVFDSTNEQATEYAYRCESDGPSKWADAGMVVTITRTDTQVAIEIREIEGWTHQGNNFGPPPTPSS